MFTRHRPAFQAVACRKGVFQKAFADPKAFYEPEKVQPSSRITRSEDNKPGTTSIQFTGANANKIH